MADVWTTGRLLEWVKDYFAKNGVDSPRLSAEMLLAHVLGVKRIDLYMQFATPVEEASLARLRELVKRCAQHEPLAYLIGRTEFYSMEFVITPDCLIPRPETELLVQRAVEFLRLREGRQRMLDLCTGSGCVAAAVAKNHPAADVVATDSSDAALAVAARNIEKHKLAERVKLLCGDLFDAIVADLDAARFDLITANPPYVGIAEYEKLPRNVKDYEPRSALVAGADGLDVYRRIAGRVDGFLKPGGALIMEIGYRQGHSVQRLLEAAGMFRRIAVEKDYSNNDRVVTAVRATK